MVLRPGTYDIRRRGMIKLKIILKKVRLALIKDNQESLNFLKKLNKTCKNYLKKEN